MTSDSKAHTEENRDAAWSSVALWTSLRRYLHAPWEMPPGVQRAAGCVVGWDYPAPVVDHAWARERVLAVYGQARGKAGERGRTV